jgi:hypothetical protein
MAFESAGTVIIRLGRKQTPHRYNDPEVMERDMVAAQVRFAQMQRDAAVAGADAAKYVEAYARLLQKRAALAGQRRLGPKADKPGTTSPEDKAGG